MMTPRTTSGWRAFSGVLAIGLAVLGWRSPAVLAGEFANLSLDAERASPVSKETVRAIGREAASMSGVPHRRQTSREGAFLPERSRVIDAQETNQINERRVLHVGRIIGATAVSMNRGPASLRAAGTLGLGEPCSCDEVCAASLGDQCNIVQCIVRSTCTGNGTTPCLFSSDCTGNGTCNTAADNFVQRCDKVQLIDWSCDADGDFCTLDRCEDDGSGTATSVCMPQDDGAGGPLSACVKHCAGGPAAFLGCDRASDCPQGSCQIVPGGDCDSAAPACFVGASLATGIGRCCTGGACSETDETACTAGGGVWYRYRSPDEQAGNGCLCPKYGSGVAPSGPDVGTIGLVRPSGLICQAGSVQTGMEVYCEDPDGDGLSPNFCLKRCVGGDKDGAPCTVNSPDCAQGGSCSTTGQSCLVSNGGSDCGICTNIGGPCVSDISCAGAETCVFDGSQSCDPTNPGTCQDDACGANGIQGSCEDGFLSIGDDYDIANGSFQRLTEFRFRGGVTNLGEDIEIEFWDSTGTQFVDAFAIRNLPLTGTHDWTIEVDCWPNCNANQGEAPNQRPIIIPSVGWVVMRSTRTVGTINGAAAFWSQTTSPADVGVNDDSKMWVNSDPLASLGTNVMIFELVGVKVPAPRGACCDDAMSCEDTLRWECGICSETDPPVLCGDTFYDCPLGGLTGSVCQVNRWFGPISHSDFEFGGPELTLCNGVAPCDQGACCDGESCFEGTAADCTAAGGDFQGIAADCTPNCCPVAVPTGSDCACTTRACEMIALSCLGGADEGSPCTTDADCAVTDPADPGECGHLNLGSVGWFCDSDLDCQAGVATCVLQCEPNGVTQLPLPYECRDAFGSPLEPPVACDPGNGNLDCLFDNPLDTCERSLTGSFSVVRTGTITGDLFTAPEGELCSLSTMVDHVGWYELINLPDPTPGDSSDDCFILTVGLCCNDPVLIPIWPFLSSFGNCPCMESADVIGQAPDVGSSGDSLDGFGDASKARFSGRCEDGNYSATFTVGPGDYAYQILADTHCAGWTIQCDDAGDCPGTSCVAPNLAYAVQFTVESCPLDACCVGDTCLTTNALDCAAQDGTFLRGVHRDHPVMGCQAGVCSLGSCCLNGQCRDDIVSNTLLECEAMGGVYLGGVVCDLNPCPVCPYEKPANCQQVQTIFGAVPLMDRNPNRDGNTLEGMVLADDVKFGGMVVDEICWNTGFFSEPCCQVGHCVANVDDRWEIRIYGPDPDCEGLPGPEVGMSTITVLNKLEGAGQATGTWHYSGRLDTSIALPNGGFAGDTYWFEVSGFGAPNCGIRAIRSRDDGNDYLVTAPIDSVTGLRDYNPSGADHVDVGFCENSGILNPGAVLGSCCTCPANCQENLTQRECRFIRGAWLACATCAQTPCPGAPANDDCNSPFLVSHVPESLDGLKVLTMTNQENICATDDGPGLLDDPFFGCVGSLVGGGDMHNDVWYAYAAASCGLLRIEGCGTVDMDQMIAVYDADNGCPLPEAGELDCADDTCGINAGPASVAVPVYEGHDYLIRVGGWNDEVAGGFTGDPRGSFTLDWSLTIGAVECFPAELMRAAAPHDILKNRYISVDPRGPTFSNPDAMHIKVMVESTEVNGLVGSGPWWATAPVSGNPPSPATCISVLSATKPATAPDWSGCPTLHLTGCPIVPTTSYLIQGEVFGDLSFGVLFDTQAKPGIKWHGDCVGFFDGVQWTPPDGVVSFGDVVAAIKTFQDPNAFNAAHLSVSDIHPNQNGASNNLIVSIGDVFAIILGFQGQEYPGPQIELCP